MLKKYMNYIRDKFSNKKGMNTIEMAIITILSIICVCGLLDLTNIMKKHNAISTTANYVTRVMGKQGGVQQAKPAMYPGEYITSSQLYDEVKLNMNSAGIEDGNWEVRVTIPGDGTKPLKEDSNYKIATHGEDMKIQLEAHYNWTMLAQVIPITPTGYNIANRETNSKFKVRTWNKVESTVQ